MLPDGEADDGLPLFRGHPPRVGHVYLMVQPGLCEVRGIALFLQICLHQGDGPRLVVKGAQVHRLHAQPLLHGEEAAREQSSFFFRVAVSTAQSRSCPLTKSGSLMTDIQRKASLSPSAPSCCQKPPAAARHIQKSHRSYDPFYSSYAMYTLFHIRVLCFYDNLHPVHLDFHCHKQKGNSF